MITLFKGLYLRHKAFWTIKENIISFIIALVLLIIAALIQRMANNYVISTGGVPVGDLLLNNIPSFDIDKIMIIGALFFTCLIVGLILCKPNYILFTLKSLAIFIIIRAFFISLTHLGMQPHQINFDSHTIGFGLYDLLYNTKNDFFFSGHTGVPFLMGLIFSKEKFWRNLLFFLTIISGMSVILGHIHYSIDVFSAPFITYSIYIIAKNIFRQDYALI